MTNEKVEDYKVKYHFLHCKNPKAIIEKLYPNEFKNTDYPNNQTKYLSFLDRVAEDGRFEELAMELGLTNYQTMTSEEEKIKEICECNQCSLIENISPQQKKVTCNRCVLSHKVREIAQWKDEQIDTILLTTEGCLRSFFESQGNTHESIDNFIDALKTQIDKNLNKL